MIMDEMPIQPYALKAGEGWTYHFDPIDVDFTVKVGEQGQGRRTALFEFTTRAGEEPPVHTHATEDEMFYVLDGEVAFRCGEQRFEVEGGGFVFLPRGIPHGYRITSPGDTRMLVITAPAPGVAEHGWDGFVGSVERDMELRRRPPVE